MLGILKQSFVPQFPKFKGNIFEESMNSLFPLWIDIYFSQVQVVGGDDFFSPGLSMHTLIDYAQPPLKADVNSN